jgi:hypothetical protein
MCLTYGTLWTTSRRCDTELLLPHPFPILEIRVRNREHRGRPPSLCNASPSCALLLVTPASLAGRSTRNSFTAIATASPQLGTSAEPVRPPGFKLLEIFRICCQLVAQLHDTVRGQHLFLPSVSKGTLQSERHQTTLDCTTCDSPLPFTSTSSLSYKAHDCAISIF